MNKNVVYKMTSSYLYTLNLTVMALTIDTHHHMLPGFFFEATNEKENPVGGLKPQTWTSEASLGFMDEAEIEAEKFINQTINKR